MATHELIETPERGKYEPAWDRYRGFERAYHGGLRALFFWFGVPLVLLALTERLYPLPELAKVLVGIFMFIACLIVCYRIGIAKRRIARFPCPRCGRRFHPFFYFTGVMHSKCPYCKLFVCQTRD